VGGKVWSNFKVMGRRRRGGTGSWWWGGEEEKGGRWGTRWGKCPPGIRCGLVYLLLLPVRLRLGP
jgi:hypothetical protein